MVSMIAALRCMVVGMSKDELDQLFRIWSEESEQRENEDITNGKYPPFNENEIALLPDQWIEAIKVYRTRNNMCSLRVAKKMLDAARASLSK
jgi:hypothetical protein